MNLLKHLLSRNYDPTRYKNQVLDFDNNVLTVYLTNLAGQFVGYQQYRPEVEFKRLNLPNEARYFTYSPRQTNACWGSKHLTQARKIYTLSKVSSKQALYTCLDIML